MEDQEQTAKTLFELENGIVASDEIFAYSKDEHMKIFETKPWTKDVKHFKKVKVSAVALVKMVAHAQSGGNIEVMGILQGKIDGDTFVILDSFALNVEATETRVNASEDALIYITNYMDLIHKVGRSESAIGWYHSHPGYGCWLSGIDVETQNLHQSSQDPFVALVIDPHRTISAGKVEIKAFRTFPDGYVAPLEVQDEYQVIPQNKIADYGVHHNRYYPLDMSFFKSSTDSQVLELLWKKYWVSTLSSSRSLLSNSYFNGRTADLSEKLRSSSPCHFCSRPSSSSSSADRIREDAAKLVSEQIQSTITEILKKNLFSVNVTNPSMDLC